MVSLHLKGRSTDKNLKSHGLLVAVFILIYIGHEYVRVNIRCTFEFMSILLHEKNYVLYTLII